MNEATDTFYVIRRNDGSFYNNAQAYNDCYPVTDGNQPWTIDLNAARIYHDRRQAQGRINANMRAQVASEGGQPHFFVPMRQASIRSVQVKRTLWT